MAILSSNTLPGCTQYCRTNCVLFVCYRGDEKKEEEEEVDIDLNDPDVEKAAVKIQAGFKGFKARQEIKDLKVGLMSHQSWL